MNVVWSEVDRHLARYALGFVVGVIGGCMYEGITQRQQENRLDEQMRTVYQDCYEALGINQKSLRACVVDTAKYSAREPPPDESSE